jgi:hypothetical protein
MRSDDLIDHTGGNRRRDNPMTSYQKGYTFYATLPVAYPEAKLSAFVSDCIAKDDADNAAYWTGALQATRDLNNRKPTREYQADIDFDAYLDRYDNER